MGSLCLSSAAILRCESLNRIQVIILVIPTVLEVISSSSLIFTRRETDDRLYLWLTAEGWIYLVLSLLEMVSHLLPAGRQGAQAFEVFDTVLAVTSFLPILFYALFILLFSRAELITVLPARFRTVSTLMLPIFVLLIGTFNELASLVGISHDIVIPGSLLILIGFKNKNDETLWTFFTSLTLALLTLYQTINFAFASYRLIGAIQDKHRIRTTEADEAHPFRGIGWICGGFKLGAIETAVGFAGGSFGVALSRRILRFLARAVVCIGIAKGLDCLEDFEEVQRELILSKASRQEYRRSRIRELISNPRLSTFRQLSPNATAFHAAPRAPNLLARHSPLALATEDIPNMTRVTSIDSVATFELGRPYQRVTMNFKNGTPVLDVRFSQLDVPSMICSKPRSRPQSEVVTGTRGVLPQHPNSGRNRVRPSHPPSLLSLLDITSDSGSESHLAGSPFFNPYTQQPERHMRSLSIDQVPPKSPLAAVRELTPQFPVVPPRAFIPPSQFMVKQGNLDATNRGSLIGFEKTDNESTTNKFSHRTPPPSNYHSAASTPKNVNLLLKYVNASMDRASTPSTETRHLDDGLFALGNALLMSSNSDNEARSPKGGANPAEWIDYNAIQPAGGVAGSGVEAQEGLSRGSELQSAGVKRKGRKTADDPSAAAVGRIKSVGEAPRRWTPAPTKSSFTRDSLRLEIAPAPRTTRVVQDRSSLDSVYSRDVLRDSEVAAIGG